MLKINPFNSHTKSVDGLPRFALVGFVCLAFFSLSFGVAAIHGQLQIKNAHFCDASGNPVQLRGMSMYAWTSAAIGFYNATAIGHLAKDWGCQAIRMPYMSSVPMTSVNNVIQACIDNGIYVIVDWHGGSASSAATTAAWFKTVATQWHTYPNIMYEPWNEPTVAWSQIKPYMETVIAAIRAIDANNIIICGNPQWDQEPQLAAADPITDATNIAYSMHFYAASHSEAGFGPGITTAMSKGCAIFITEYGTCASTGGAPINLTATQTWWNFLDANKIGSTNWGVEAEDQGGAAAFTKSASNTGPWADGVITSEGLAVKAYILKGTEALPNDFKPFKRADAPTWNNLLTGVNTNSVAVFTVNGVRCHTGSKLANGLFIYQFPGNAAAKGVNIIR